MQQSERVSSTTNGVEGGEGGEGPGDGEEESDLDSWPEDTTSPHDSNDHITLLTISYHHITHHTDFYSESEYDDTEATSTTSTSMRENLSCGPCQSCRSPVMVRYQAFSLAHTNPPAQPFRYSRKLFSNNR